MEQGIQQNVNSQEAQITSDIYDNDIFQQIKLAFRKWILNSCSGKRNPDKLITSWDYVSEGLLSRKLSSVPLWEMTNQELFKTLYKKVLDDKFLRVMDKGVYDAFVQIGQLYNKFLKTKPLLHKDFHGDGLVVNNESNIHKSNQVDREDSNNTIFSYLSENEFLKDNKIENKGYNTIIENKNLEYENAERVIMTIMEERFPNGIRPNSVIDINKLKNYCCEAVGEYLISPNMEVSSVLKTIGISYGEKVFPISQRGRNKLTDLCNQLVDEGNRLFFYEEFYDVHVNFLQEIHIFSAELLKAALTQLMPSFYFSKNYFGVLDNLLIETEILQCFDSVVCLSYEQLKGKLPYIPIEKIKQVLAQNSEYIWVEMGVYTHISKIYVDYKEVHLIENKIKAEIAKCGYVSLTSLDVSTNLETNPELSEISIKNGLFQMFFSESYYKRGNIITPKGSILNSVAVFEDFCLSHTCLTLNELLDFERDINGSIHSQALFVAYDTMIRVDEDTFVSDFEIEFDSVAIDNTIALFAKSEIIPIRAITSFTSFPYIEGYSWNLFLLESYCRRFSKQYEFQCLSVSSKNVGAIIPKFMNLGDYVSVLAMAVAKADLELEEKEVADFLFYSGYVARRTNIIAEIVTKARIVRERMVDNNVWLHT